MEKKREIKVEVDFTPGYEQRFTKAVLNIYGKRVIEEKRTRDKQKQAV